MAKRPQGKEQIITVAQLKTIQVYEDRSFQKDNCYSTDYAGCTELPLTKTSRK